MAEFDEKQLKAHIKSGDFLPVYLFCGNEAYLKKYYSDTLAEKAVSKDFFDFNLQTFDGKGIDIQEIIDAAIMMPLMSDRRAVVVRDLKLEAMNDSDFTLLKDYLENPSESTVLIFLQTADDFSLLKAKKIADIIKKKGAVCQLNKRSGNDLIKPLISSASKQGCVLTADGAHYLVSVVGDDFNVLINELSKVCHYAAGGEITKKHIDEVAVKTDEARIYDLTKFLLMKNFDKAYEVLGILLRQKTQPEFILGTIVGAYVDMYRAKVSLACGKGAEELSEAYGYGKTAFRLKNGARDSSRIDIDTLRKCIDVLTEADLKLKSGRDNPAVILEQLMVRLFLVSNGDKV
ncbi:MAG: DNA polymerase III subunit delta [Clostridia bacterium]|nr:DNA polymerase III subunit delta [Clostridia bacterium]